MWPTGDRRAWIAVANLTSSAADFKSSGASWGRSSDAREDGSLHNLSTMDEFDDFDGLIDFEADLLEEVNGERSICAKI